MVRWLDPHQLVGTAARLVVAGLFSVSSGLPARPRHWTLRPDDPPAAPWFAPASPLVPRLIEQPLRIER
ncbi:MAG TPA: hypothetical protein VM388_14700 [Acidimicrobiales bacterium]|nr:hypothetical protein [Acidimicrobiales bacterium]